MPRTASASSPRAVGPGTPHVKRPSNAFLLFRSAEHRTLTAAERKLSQGTLLKEVITPRWHALSPTERAVWYQRAEEVKAQHAIDNPDYKYAPGASKASKARTPQKSNNPVAHTAGTGNGSSPMPTTRLAQPSFSPIPAPNVPHSLSQGDHSYHPTPNAYGTADTMFLFEQWPAEQYAEQYMPPASASWTGRGPEELHQSLGSPDWYE